MIPSIILMNLFTDRVAVLRWFFAIVFPQNVSSSSSTSRKLFSTFRRLFFDGRFGRIFHLWYISGEFIRSTPLSRRRGRDPLSIGLCEQNFGTVRTKSLACSLGQFLFNHFHRLLHSPIGIEFGKLNGHASRRRYHSRARRERPRQVLQAKGT